MRKSKFVRRILPTIAAVAPLIYAYSVWAQSTSPKAFTATETTSMLGGGSGPKAFTRVHAFRSDGTFVSESDLLFHGMKMRHINLHGGKHIVVDKDLRQYASLTFPPRLDLSARKVAGSDCAAYTESDATKIGRDSILGVDVVKYGWGGIEPTSGEYWHTAAYAPSLNCFKMSAKHIWANDDGAISGQTIETVTSLTIGEPDAEFFAIDPNWKLVSHIKLRENGLTARGVSLDQVSESQRKSWELISKAGKEEVPQ